MYEPNRHYINSELPGRIDAYLPAASDQGIVEDAGSGVPLDLPKLIRKYVVLAVLFITAGGAAGFFSVALMPAVFKAKALLQVQQAGGNILKPQNVEDYGQEQVDLLTEAQILRSNTFLRRVLERLQVEGVSPAPVQHDIFSQLRRLLKKESDDQVSVSVAVDGLNAARTPKPLAMALMTLDIHPVERTHLLELTCESTNPQFAADFLNALSDEYIQHNYQARMESVKTTSQWVLGQLEETKAKMIESERRLQEFMRDSGNLFVTQESTLADSKLRDLQQKLSSAQSELIAKQARYDMVKRSTPEALPDVLGDETVRQYQTRIADLRREEAVLTVNLLPEHPKIKKIESQIADVQASLQKEVAAAVKRINSEYATALHDQELLQKNYATVAQQVSSQAGKQTQYEALKKESETARQAYNTMLMQANEASVAGSVPVNNIQPIDRAVPPERPYKPKPLINIGMGFAAGLGLCCGIVFLREKMDRRVNSPDHARQLFNIPQLGVIPSDEEGCDHESRRFLPGLRRSPVTSEISGLLPAPGHPEDHSTNPSIYSRKPLLAESFRVTLASLMRESVGLRRPQVILVTSPGPGEGKTTIASNLSMALAETGRRVLLCDADFRRPSVHKVFGIACTRGLVDLLAEQTPVVEYPREALGVRTSVPNLLVLPNGSRSENIAKALYSLRLRELIQRLRKEFDTVLIDAPPLLPVADARVLSEMSDGIVLVLRSGVTEKDSVVETLDQLRADRAVVLGTVFNDWKPTKSQAKARYYYSALDSYER